MNPEVKVKLLGRSGIFNEEGKLEPLTYKFIAKTARVSGVPADIPDEDIIRMIVENDYTSCLEHMYFTFDITMTKLIAPEFLEHRIASHTAKSTRFTSNIEAGWLMPKYFEELSKKTSVETRKEMEKYGMVVTYREGVEVINKFCEAVEDIFKIYTDLRNLNVPRDYARNVLPLCTTTRYIWTINARSLINFLGLRLCVRAYKGIREMAKQIHEILKREEPEIFRRVGCRGYTLGVCPENEARPKNCPFIGIIPTKNEIKDEWKEKGYKTVLKEWMKNDK